MRRALDVGSHEGRGRHDQAHGPRPVRQFAQDGDVPVVRLQGRKDPTAPTVARLEELLQIERAAREQADAALKQANASIQALQTKIAHAEIAHVEALAAQGRSFESRLAEQAAACETAQAAVQAAPKLDAEPKRVRAAAARQTASAAAEEEPVEWWVPGWREGLAGPR